MTCHHRGPCFNRQRSFKKDKSDPILKQRQRQCSTSLEVAILQVFTCLGKILSRSAEELSAIFVPNQLSTPATKTKSKGQLQRPTAILKPISSQTAQITTFIFLNSYIKYLKYNQSFKAMHLPTVTQIVGKKQEQLRPTICLQMSAGCIRIF